MDVQDKVETGWLEDALPLKPVLAKSARLRRLVDELFDEITPLITVSSKSRQKATLKAVIINLLSAYALHKPVRYYRDKNAYARDRRYGKLYYKYDRVIPIIDALEKLGYAEQKKGFFSRERREGRQTRVWGTKKLWSRCGRNGLTNPAFPLVPEIPHDEEVIVLRDEEKRDIRYKDDRRTIQMRENLERYNEFADGHRVSACLDGSSVVDNRFLVENLYGNIQQGRVWIEKVRLNERHKKYKYSTPIPGFTRHQIPFHQHPTLVHQEQRDNDPTSITKVKRRADTLGLLLRRYWSEAFFFERDIEQLCVVVSLIPWRERQEVLARQHVLRDVGVDELVFFLEEKRMRRIFNRSSWKKGGRAYGGLHQSVLRKHMREGILINGEPTKEIDFSAYHILMLYHREGIDYQGDPYTACEGPGLRNIYKAVGLIAINAEGKSASKAIQDELRDRGLVAPRRRKPIRTLINRFREAHRDIEQYLYSGVGLDLQNIDSHIMNAILVRLMDHGILGLSVFDSVIVPAQHEAFTKQVMTEEYEKVMGFRPRF